MCALVLVLLALLLASPAEAQRNCRKGIPCGNTCIAATKTCRVGTGSARPAPDPAPAPAAARAAPAAPSHRTICAIAAVTDGDTVRCDDGTRVRLLLVDAPEMNQGDYGRTARDSLRALLPVGALATLELDVDRQDRYGRTLAYVYLPDGRMVNELLASRGLVVTSVYPPNVRYVERIRAAVEEARVARRGLWSESAFDCTPANHRAGRC